MATISKIEIEGFKAFPKYFSLDFGDKNLLMYGENGSGKSSIYYALHALLQSVYKDDKGAKYFKTIEDSSTGEGSFVSDENLVNIYRYEDVKKNVFQPYIKITLDNGNVWKLDRGGLQSANGDDYREIRILNTTTTFINHSYISRFHSARNSEKIDLWNVFIKDILPFCAKSDEDKSLADVYYDIIAERPKGKAEIDNLKKRIQSFNVRLYNDVIGEINKKTTDTYNQYFKNEGDPELVVTLRYFAENDETNNPLHEEYYLAFDKFHGSQYSLRYPRIGIDVVSDSQPIYKPQSFFNEAKLTAIALSVRFALLNLDKPLDGRFLALDDMLISLDMSNRSKVVDFLLKISDKYKIYLFTHDRAFFEHCKERISYSNRAKGLSQCEGWLFKELYNNENPQDNPKELDSSSDVARAMKHYKDFDYPASANYLRKAVESLVREVFPPKMERQEDGLKHEKLRNILEVSFAFFQTIPGIDLSDMGRLIGNLNLLLNPLSHKSTETDVYKSEIKELFVILEKLRKQISALCIREVLARKNYVYLYFKENEHITQKYEIELQEELYSYLSGAVRIFCQAKAKSTRSCTITDGVEGTYVNNQHYKGDLEKICQDVHTHKGKVYANNYMDFYKDKDGNDLISLI